MIRTLLKRAGRWAMPAMLLTLTSAHAAPSGIVLAGGELDAGITGADVYVGTPQQAQAGSGRACKAAEAYVDIVNSGQFAKIGDLFAEDAAFLEPSGRQNVRGREQIRAHFTGVVAKMKPQVIAVAYLGDDTDCMVELASRIQVNGQPRYALVSVDHFSLAPDGRVIRMVAFARPPRKQ